MSFIKSYWWVFALLIGAFLIYWFMFRTPAKTIPTVTLPPKLNPACPLSVQEWLDLVAAKETEITGAWLTAVQAKVGTAVGQYPTLAAAKKAEAIWALENQSQVCNPTKPPVA